jgi:rod shape determining protein RodA
MIQPLRSQSFWRDFDWLLFSAPVLLSLISLTEIYSSTMGFAHKGYLLRQLAAVCVGIVFLFVVAAIDYHALAERIPWIYLLSVLGLMYVLVLGKTVNGSKSWVGIGPLTFQPSELVKMVTVVALARYLSDLRSSKYMSISQLVKGIMICAVPLLLVGLQPDLGTAVTYVPILLVGLFIRGVKPVLLISGVLVVILILPASWFVLRPHQKDRIMNFVYPDRDPLKSGYQVIQSKIAIGSGGVVGKGLFKGTQNQLGFLPTRHTDFILSVVGEELGFLGVTLTLGLLSFILFRSVYNAQTARDKLGLFIIMGVVGILFFHMVVNVGMVIGFVPTAGIPLPFMSYGGSSVLTCFIGVGLIISVRRRRYVN